MTAENLSKQELHELVSDSEKTIAQLEERITELKAENFKLKGENGQLKKKQSLHQGGIVKPH
jgi:regulator of replication initiation timing